MLLLVFRRMFSSKWIIICLLVGSVIATAIASCIPIYTDGILQRMLTKDLENYQKDTGDYPGIYQISTYFESNFYKDIPKAFQFFDKKITEDLSGDFGLPFLTVRREISSDGLELKTTKLQGDTATWFVDMGAIEKLAEHITITNGRMYSGQTDGNVYEIIVTSKAMWEFNLLLNREYTLRWTPTGQKEAQLNVKVVGVFTIKDTGDAFWNKATAEYDRTFFLDYALFRQDFTKENYNLLSKAEWFYALDYHKVSIDSIGSILTQYAAQAEWVKPYQTNMEFKMSMVSLLEKYLERARQLKKTLWVLTMPIFMMLAFYIFMVSRLIVLQDENGIAVLKSRGASKKLIFQSYLLESLIIGALALALGLPLGMTLCKVMGAANGFLEFVGRTGLPLHYKKDAILYSVVAVALFVITMLIPVILASKPSIVNYMQKTARHSKPPLWKRFFLDILILVSSGYGIYRYQQHQNILETGIQAEDIRIDPLLFLSSTLFILGAGLFFLRIYPYLIRFIHWLGRKLWTPIMYASLLQVGRSGGREQFLMLFIILAVSSGVFSANAARTININAEDKIKYQTGADIRLTAVWKDNQPPELSPMAVRDPSDELKKEPLRYKEPDYKLYSTLSGTERATKVLSVNGASIDYYNQTAIDIKLMAINPSEFAQIAWFRNDLLPYRWYQYLNVMAEAPEAFLLSVDLKDRLKLKPGDPISVSWGNQSAIQGVVYAFIDYWPTYNPNPISAGKEPAGLIVANFSNVDSRLAVQPYDVWIKKKDGVTDKQINDDILRKKLSIEKITYRNQQMILAKNEPMLQGINGMLTLGFVAAMIISTLGFLIYWILSIQSRVMYFGILRAMGLSKEKVIGIIGWEQVLVSGAAILTGFLIGELACDLFIPMLQIVYSAAEQVPPFRIITVAGDYVKIYAVVALMLLLGFGILWRIIARIRIDQALKMGED